MNASADTAETGTTIRALIAIVSIIVVCAIAAVAYYYLRGVNMAKQAETVSSSFVKSSPVVETNLGAIVKMKEISAGRVQGSANKWRVEYRVTGQKAQGSVDILVQNAKGNWNVPSAQLHETGGKPVNLL
jgi:hypothetical protein